MLKQTRRPNPKDPGHDQASFPVRKIVYENCQQNVSGISAKSTVV